MNQIFAWYAALLVLGLVFYPMTAQLFPFFRDRGWLFSRVLGLMAAGFLLWFLNTAELFPFFQSAAVLTVVFFLILNATAFFVGKRRERFRRTAGAVTQSGARAAGRTGGVSFKDILIDEALFLIVFALALWLIRYKPEAYGTEKFMDYGFLTAMLRSETMPFADPWFAGEKINYYYGGQYMTAFLIRLAGVTAGYGYNLMRATVTALSFGLPFSLVRGAAENFLNCRKTNKAAQSRAAFAGLFAGLAVAFAGSGHFLVYGIILVIKEKIRPGSVTPLADYPDRPYFYWFPDSTRYIGYYPDTPDKTIHEFPAYSSILGDLHAHYLNLIFVLLIAAVLYAWLIRMENKKLVSDPGLGGLIKEALADPALIIAGFMTGLFRWTNYWDFPIYLVVTGAVVFFGLLRKYRRDMIRFFVNLILKAVLILLAGFFAALPFVESFDMIASEVHLVRSHTPLYQLAILWGIPAVAVLLLFLMIMRTFHKEDILEYADEQAVIEAARRAPDAAGTDGSAAETADSLIYRPKGFMRLLATIAPEDLFMLILGVSALGLVLLPEIVYVRDIYEGDHYRANTMFKLTYQAFILLGITMGYVIARARANKAVFYRAAGIVLAGLILILSTYSVRGAIDWFTPGRTEPKGLDAAVYLDMIFPNDKGACDWLNAHVDGQLVVLEANGDSYSDYGRVSVATGLPTVLGWYVHEWLWRGGTAELNERSADIETIYTSDDKEEVWELIRKYHISYIYIGQLERDKYGFVNDRLLQSIGEVAYSDGESTYIMRVG